MAHPDLDELLDVLLPFAKKMQLFATAAEKKIFVKTQ